MEYFKIIKLAISMTLVAIVGCHPAPTVQLRNNFGQTVKISSDEEITLLEPRETLNMRVDRLQKSRIIAKVGTITISNSSTEVANYFQKIDPPFKSVLIIRSDGLSCSHLSPDGHGAYKLSKDIKHISNWN